MYVRILSDSTRDVVVSTLDLVSTEKVEFLLIISPLQESYELARATFKVAKEFMANVKVCIISYLDQRISASLYFMFLVIIAIFLIE